MHPYLMCGSPPCFLPVKICFGCSVNGSRPNTAFLSQSRRMMSSLLALTPLSIGISPRPCITCIPAMGLFNKLTSKLDSVGSGSGQGDYAFPPGPAPQPPGPSLIPRYRKQRGVNLGSWFVLEGWMAPASVFREAVKPKQSDMDVAKGGNAKRILEEHWDNWITEEDWKWLKEHGYNSVRIPVSHPSIMW